jgi:Phage gp6-like head-tail connector protein
MATIITLQDVKDEEGIDESNTFFDRTLSRLVKVADEYVKGATGFTFPDPEKTPERAKHAAIMLVSHWFRNKTPVVTNGAAPANVPYTVAALLTQVSLTYSDPVEVVE